MENNDKNAKIMEPSLQIIPKNKQLIIVSFGLRNLSLKANLWVTMVFPNLLFKGYFIAFWKVLWKLKWSHEKECMDATYFKKFCEVCYQDDENNYYLIEPHY